MAIVSDTFKARWFSGNHIADAKPTMQIRIRKGHFERHYNGDWPWPDMTGVLIANSNNSSPWQATWHPDTDYMDVPNVLECSFEQSLDQNGITTGSITIENIVYPEITGVAGIYHAIKRGYLAPYRGYSRLSYPDWQAEQNEWFELLNSNAQITIWQGYGDAMTRTFTGLIDDVDLTSHPDRIVVSARDFGQALIDQHVFGYVKDPACHDPITFIDKLQADKLQKVGYAAVSGTVDDSSHGAKEVLDTDPSTYWRSSTYDGPNATDWIEIHVPQGRYDSFYLWNKYPGMTGYLSVFMRPRDDGKACMWDGAEVPDNQWVDVNTLGDVPGDLGGEPYVQLWENMPNDRGYYHQFGHNAMNQPIEMECGPGSVIRVSYRDLQLSGGGYHAGVTRMVALKRSLTADAIKHHFILVSDVADIIRVCLRWAGFKTWEVENTGVRLAKRFVVDRSMTLMDVIKKVTDQTDFLFYIGDPREEFPEDMGTPIFRHISAVRDETPAIAINERQLLTGIHAKFSDEPLSTIIRTRGAPISDDLEKKTSNKHVHYTFRPPWSERMAGLIKHVVHNDPKLKTQEDCQFAAYYIALEEALQSATGTIEVPGYPGIELDEFAGLFDEGTGLSTRVWVSNRSSTFRTGEQGSWKMSLGGTLVDVPDVQDMANIINAAVRSDEP